MKTLVKSKTSEGPTSESKLLQKGASLALGIGSILLCVALAIQWLSLGRFFAPGSSEFIGDDFSDVPDLVQRLKVAPRGSVDEWIVSRLSKDLIEAIERSKDPQSIGSESEVRDLLAKDFNRLREGKLVWGDHFREVRLRPQTELLLGQRQTHGKLQRLNRLLLEDAYPRTVDRSPHFFEEWRDISLLVSSILTTMATAIGTLGAGTLAKEWFLKTVDKGRFENFREFFGHRATTEAVRLVHANRKIPLECNLKHASPSLNGLCNGSQEEFAKPEGIGKWLPAEDNLAATAISAAFAQRSPHFPRQVYDTFIEDDTMSHCTIGLGLGFNEMTHFACTLTRGHMFRIVFKKSVKRSAGSVAKPSKNPVCPSPDPNSVEVVAANPKDGSLDALETPSRAEGSDIASPCKGARRISESATTHENECNQSERISPTDEFVVPYLDGEKRVKWQFPVPGEGCDVAIILRIPTPIGDGAEYTTQFVVAGRSATGTAVAGAFLATRWEEIHDLYERNGTGKARDLNRHALLVILEHKQDIIHRDDPLIVLSGARWYTGRYQEYEEGCDGIPKPSSLGELGCACGSDAEFEEYADTLKRCGYGFYDPNCTEAVAASSGG